MCETDCNKVLNTWYDTINKFSKADLETFIKTHQQSNLYKAEQEFQEKFFQGSGGGELEVFGLFSAGGGGGKEQRDAYMKNTTVAQLNLLDNTGSLTSHAYNSFYSRTASPIALQAYIKCLEHCKPSSIKTNVAGDLAPKGESSEGKFSVFVNYLRSNEWEPDKLTIQVLYSTGLVLLSSSPQRNSKGEYSVKNGQGIVLNFQRINAAEQTVSINPEKMPTKTVPIPKAIPESEKAHKDIVFTVDSQNSSWQDTGVMLDQGDIVETKVIAGRWTVAHQALPENPFVTGTGYADRPAGIPPHYEGQVFIGELVAKVGPTKFGIGNGKNFTADSNDKLELVMFDNAGPGNANDPGYADNFGKLDVQIKVYKPKPAVVHAAVGAPGAAVAKTTGIWF